jgi:hypothetical protein
VILSFDIVLCLREQGLRQTKQRTISKDKITTKKKKKQKQNGARNQTKQSNKLKIRPEKNPQKIIGHSEIQIKEKT